MEPADGMKIRITKDGPYLVSGGVPLAKQSILVDSEGESVSWLEDANMPQRDSCGLCRCGQSANKPFCDGSHASVGFDGTETAMREPYAETCEILKGPRVNVADVPSLCAEARFCHRAGTVWHLVDHDSAQAAETVELECALCPSGRYTAIDRETGEFEEPEYEPSIGFVQDPHKDVSGPIWVRGGIAIESSDGHQYEVRNRVTLCRCGKSENKPFCDGSHVAHEFHDHL
jgi:CDGSH-type Zn-finger protein